MSLNTCTISGYLGRAAELRYTSAGTPVIGFSVAVGSRRKKQDGTYEDVADWFDCKMFGKRAEALQPYLGKGCKVSIIGHLYKSVYEKYDEMRSKVEIIVDEIELMNSRREKQRQPEDDLPGHLQATSGSKVHASDIAH